MSRLTTATLLRRVAVLQELSSKGPRTVSELCDGLRDRGVADGWYAEVYSAVRSLEKMNTVICFRMDNRLLVAIPEHDAGQLAL